MQNSHYLSLIYKYINPVSGNHHFFLRLCVSVWKNKFEPDWLKLDRNPPQSRLWGSIRKKIHVNPDS